MVRLNWKPVLLVALFIGTFFALPSNVSPVQEADGLRVMATIEILNSPGYVDVAPGTHSSVTFNGNVKIVAQGLGDNVQIVLVTLEGTSAQGWPVTITPSQLSLKPQGGSAQGTFTATVVVPPKTSYKVTDEITFSGFAKGWPGAFGMSMTPSKAVVYVNQYYMYTVSSDKPYKQISPGDQTAFAIHIKNDGNGDDIYRIDIPELAKLQDADWAITLSQQRIMVDEGKEVTITVSVNTPQEWHVMWYNKVKSFTVSVTSQQAVERQQTTMPQSFTLIVRQRGVSTPGFDPFLVIVGFALISAALAVQLESDKKVRLRRRR